MIGIIVQSALGGLILTAIYKFLNSNSEYDIDWWMAAGFIAVPMVLLIFLRILFAMIGLDEGWLFLGYTLHFIVPLLTLKIGFEYQTKIAAKYSIFVPIVTLVVELIFYFLLNLIRA